MSNLIRVLIVDDHPIIRSGIKSILDKEEDITVVGEAMNCAEAIESTAHLQPDVVLMDLNLPDRNGIEAIKEILAQNTTVRILVLSNYSEEKMIYKALEAGALGYLLKIDTLEQISNAIRTVFQGNPSLSPDVERGLLTYLKLGQNTTASRGKLLTKREIVILQMMAEGKTNAAMAEKANISEGTVRTHISNILGKLNLQNRAQAVIFAVKEGMIELEKKR